MADISTPNLKTSWLSISDRIEGKVAARTAIAASLGWIMGLIISHYTDRPDSLVSGLWCAVTAVVVLQANLGGTYKAAWARLLGVIVGSVFGGLCTVLFGSNPLSLAVSIFLTVIICSMMNIKDSVRIACLSVCIVLVLWGLRPTISPWSFALYRVIDSIMGIFIAVGVAHFIWPSQATHKLRVNMAQILLDLRQLYGIFTSPQLNGATNILSNENDLQGLLREIRVLMLQNVKFLEEAQMELLTNPEKLGEWTLLHDHFRNLLKAIVALKSVSENSRKIIDESLSTEAMHLIMQSDVAMQGLYEPLITVKPAGLFVDLLDAQEKLEADLNRFRSTHRTRPFSLVEVESFFVFYYSLNSVVTEIHNIAKSLNVLNAEE